MPILVLCLSADPIPFTPINQHCNNDGCDTEQKRNACDTTRKPQQEFISSGKLERSRPLWEQSLFIIYSDLILSQLTTTTGNVNTDFLSAGPYMATFDIMHVSPPKTRVDLMFGTFWNQEK